MDKFLKNLLWVFGILAIVNLLVLDFVWMRFKTTNSQSQAPTPMPTPRIIVSPSPTQTAGETCSADCLTKIQQEVKKAVGQEKIIQAIPTSTAAKVAYIAVGSTGSTASTSWADISGTDFYFNLTDYPQVKAVRWEASLQSYLSSDPVYVRLYDVTNNRAVDGSDLTTTSPTYQYIRSSDLTIWRGNNLYRIQAKGSNGNVVNVSAARLKVILD